MRDIKKIWYIFNQKQKINICFLLLLTIFTTLFELLAVSAIMPFVNVAMDADAIENGGTFEKIYHLSEATDRNEFLIMLALLLAVIYFIKNAALILLYNFQYQFTYRSQSILEVNLLTCYLEQDYLFHLEKNSAELQRNIIQDVTGFFLSVLAYLQLISEACVCVTLFLYLLYVDVTITIGVTIMMVLFVIIFLAVFRKKMNKIGIASRGASAKRVQWVQQALGGIKEIKILGRELFFLNSYEKNAREYAEKLRKYQLTTNIPRPLMEAMCICGLLVIVALQLGRGVDISYFIPILSAFTIAAFRLLPSFTRISGYIGTIAFQKSALVNVYHDIKEVEVLRKNLKKSAAEENGFKAGDIVIDKLYFRYPNTETNVLKQVSFRIKHNKSVALIGPSGAGKTTLADLILGVLQPYAGSISVNRKNIYENMETWHNMIGYIPQNIYLMDDSIKKNIAFGIEEKEIEDQRIIEVLKEAQLYDFVQTLEDGVNTIIGEGGIRMSGGQRQRIGIARALYTNPQILVLDEATSALDSDTEQAIMTSINALHGNKTLIIIAHRLTTIQQCDYVYEVKNQDVRLRMGEGYIGYKGE